ncbi:muconolactone Delta-isomerase family protein [Shinella pollutisoli]|uniref:Muconolactone Delta-isomerase family protein n=1 Tax=Shinella pollutisoli TaxID=2250594 RepID=A0ABV7DNK1_9HYPH|nr:muconolactone Delta-isomerase family protein [Shinella pollutisoli]
MQFLVLTRRKTEAFTTADFAEKFDAEVARARELYGEQFTRQIWHRADGSGACQIVEAPDEQTVADRINTLPFARAGMLDITIVPLKPYAGFSG